MTADDLTDAGEYRITVEYSGEDSEYAEIPDEVLELTIDKAEINESDVRFTDGSGEGDGLKFDIDVGEEVPEIHIDAGSLPSGVTLQAIAARICYAEHQPDSVSSDRSGLLRRDGRL